MALKLRALFSILRDGGGIKLAQSTLDFLRHFNLEEVSSRIQIIFTGFVDDAKMLVILGLFIGQNPVNLAYNKVFAPGVFQTDSESGRFFGFHDFNPEIV
jgi:hypothetical protein